MRKKWVYRKERFLECLLLYRKKVDWYRTEQNENQTNMFFQEFVVKMWSNQETSVQKQVKKTCEAVRYAMHSSGKNSLAVGLSPYKIAKIDAFASKLAGRLFLPFYMARSVHKIFTK